MALPEHCAYCFDVLIAACSPSPTSSRAAAEAAPPSSPRPIGLEAKHWEQEYPLFVTWNKLRRNEDLKSGYSLRGCIGCFSPLELESGLKDYTIKSALEDTRFSPVAASEISQLQCAVSLLMNFTPAAHVHDWIIGTHGLRIEFAAGGRRYSSTYLPEVAAEQGWTHERTITSLVAKAGYNKPVTRELLDSIKVTRYQSSKSYLSYAEYCALRSKSKSGMSASASASSSDSESMMVMSASSDSLASSPSPSSAASAAAAAAADAVPPPAAARKAIAAKA